MTKCTLLIFLGLLTAKSISAQTLDQYVDHLFFGVLSDNPDSSIKGFLAEYVLVLIKKPANTAGQWQAFPPDFAQNPKFMTVRNVFVFQQNPYFSAEFKTGELAITQEIYADKKWADQVTDIRLSFVFAMEAEAKKAFQQLVDSFSIFHTLKRVYQKDGIEQVEFTDPNVPQYYGHIRVSLVKDFTAGKSLMEVKEKGTELVVKPGYAIMIEPENELY